MVGDEIVNVNGRRLRGLTMAEAKAVLRGCCSDKREIDVVIARESTAKNNDLSNKSTDATKSRSDEGVQPLSLLANHDEQDLINLSSVPLRPEVTSPEVPAEPEMTSEIAQNNSTIIRINGGVDDNKGEVIKSQVTGGNRILPKMPNGRSGHRIHSDEKVISSQFCTLPRKPKHSGKTF